MRARSRHEVRSHQQNHAQDPSSGTRVVMAAVACANALLYKFNRGRACSLPQIRGAQYTSKTLRCFYWNSPTPPPPPRSPFLGNPSFLSKAKPRTVLGPGGGLYTQALRKTRSKAIGTPLISPNSSWSNRTQTVPLAR